MANEKIRNAYKIGQRIYPFGAASSGNRVIGRRFNKRTGAPEYILDDVDNCDARGHWAPYWWTESELKAKGE